MARVRNRYTGAVTESAKPPVLALAEAAMAEDGVVLTERWLTYYKSLVWKHGAGYKLGNLETVNE
jgi:hypothetical protein